MKGRTLKQVVTRAGKPVELAVRVRHDKAKRTRAKQSERLERKASSRIPSKSRSIANMTKSKRAANPTSSNKAIVELCLVETRPVGEENAPVQSAITVHEIAPRHNIRIVEAEVQEPGFTQ